MIQVLHCVHYIPMGDHALMQGVNVADNLPAGNLDLAKSHGSPMHTASEETDIWKLLCILAKGIFSCQAQINALHRD